MLNLLLILNLFMGYENTELPTLKLQESNSNVVFTEFKTSRRFFLPRRSTYVEVETIELPAIKEGFESSQSVEIVEVSKRQPIKKLTSAVKNIISDVRILPRRGTIIRGNDGTPIVTEENVITTTTKTVTEVKKSESQVKVPVDEKQEEQAVIIYEDRRFFSGRGRSRIFFKSR